MAIRSGFFNSVNGDRKYDANKFAEYFNSFIGNGVFPNPSTNLQVIANDDMTVTVQAGKAWINGYILINDDDYVLEIEPADGALNRIDRIVARYDTVDREIRLEVKKGTFASSPVAPTLQRDADAYELCLAEVMVGKGIISITQANITDTRLNKDLCGIVHGTVDQVDTTTLFNQYVGWYQDTTGQAEIDIEIMKQQLQSDINLFLQEWRNWFNSTTVAKENEFNTWFENVQIVLDENAAGNLLNLINEHKADYMPHNSELNQYASDIDDNGIYKVIEFKRPNNTLYMKSMLSNADEEGNYQTVTWEFYDETGTTVKLTKTWTLTYDEDGFVQQKVVM